MARKMESGGIVEEIRELRQVMEEMVVVLRKMAREMERREEVGQESAGVAVRTEKEGVEEESRVEGERREKEERRGEKEGRKVEESTTGKWKAAEVRKELLLATGWGMGRKGLEQKETETRKEERQDRESRAQEKRRGERGRWKAE